MNIRKTESAFHWIVGILHDNNIPFVITGGFAARLYGSQRELADIDVVIPVGSLSRIADIIKPYAIFGPGQYKDENWDLYMATLEYEGQEIDLCENETTKFFNQKTLAWEEMKTDFESAQKMEVFGMMISVVTKEALIERKQRLAREVDLEDLRQLGG